MTEEKLTNNYVIKESLGIALVQLLKEKELSRITVSELAEKAGVGRVSFYRNFGTKDNLLRYVIGNITDGFIKNSGIDLKDPLSKESLTKLYSHLYDYREVTPLLIRDHRMDFVKDQFDRILIDPDSSYREKYLSSFLSGALYNVYCAWAKGGFIETPEEIADIISSGGTKLGEINRKK
ncbi:MAG: TetR/AcrR family transcriptional regulator [Oscillospiraceae bacterium]|jgi:AcrR family transcriptional regulator